MNSGRRFVAFHCTVERWLRQEMMGPLRVPHQRGCFRFGDIFQPLDHCTFLLKPAPLAGWVLKSKPRGQGTITRRFAPIFCVRRVRFW